MTVTLGNFNTFLGYEVISPAANFNYSTSYMFSYGPFSHTGMKLDFSVIFSMKMDETTSLCKYVSASSHYLESWGDFQFVNGEYSICQPTIKNLFDTKQFEECLLSWSGNENSIYDEIKSNWSNNILLSNTKWNKAIHDGVYSSYDSYNLKSSNNSFSDSALELSKIKSSNFELLLLECGHTCY